MNYRTILNDYLPIEQGDFMLRYKINGRGYVLFSPKKDVVSCIELYNFSEISPMQLALLLTFQPKDEQDEFSFSASCTKEQIIDYLFDVEESQGCAKIRHTSGLQGYLLYDLAKADKVRNLFQFDLEKKNLVCCLTIGTVPLLCMGIVRAASSTCVGILVCSTPLKRGENRMHRLTCWLLLLPLYAVTC